MYAWTYLWLWKVELVNVTASSSRTQTINPYLHGSFIQALFVRMAGCNFSDNVAGSTTIQALGLVVSDSVFCNNAKHGLLIYMRAEANAHFGLIVTAKEANDIMTAGYALPRIRNSYCMFPFGARVRSTQNIPMS